MNLRPFLPGALLALAAPASATDFDLTATITPTETMQEAAFVYVLDASSVIGPGALGGGFLRLTDGDKVIPGGTSTTISGTFSNEFDLPVLGYTVMGVYGPTGHDGATIAYNPTVADDLVKDAKPWPYDAFFFTEERYIDAFHPLEGPNFNPDAINILYNLMQSRGELAAPGSDASLVNFSTATAGGTVTNVRFTPVPEPASLAALGLGVFCLRRRRRAA